MISLKTVYIDGNVGEAHLKFVLMKNVQSIVIINGVFFGATAPSGPGPPHSLGF